MDVPKDPEARGTKISGRVGKILVDLGEPGSDDLIAQGKVGEGECLNQNGVVPERGMPGRLNTSR